MGKHCGRWRPRSASGLAIIRQRSSTANPVERDTRAPLAIPAVPPFANNALAFDGRTRITVAKSADFDMTNRDYTIFARIKTRRGGTIFKAAEVGPWVKDGKTLFVDGTNEEDITGNCSSTLGGLAMSSQARTRSTTTSGTTQG